MDVPKDIAELGISAFDWSKTPQSVRGALLVLVAKLAEQVAEIAKVRSRVEVVEEKLGENSSNSSKPPSSDPPSDRAERKRKKGEGRKPGGQPGHKGHQRSLLPIEQMKNVTPVKPTTCDRCGAALSGDDPNPLRHQVTDVPPVQPEHNEWQLHELGCTCGHLTRAKLPDGVPHGAFGPRVLALVALFAGAYRLSRRTVQQAMKDLFSVDISLGSVSNSEQVVSAAVEAPVAEAHDYVEQQPVAFVDETGWKQRAKSAFVWVASTATVAIYQIVTSRGREAAERLLGAFRGVLTSDRYIVYAAWDVKRRQLCWAHLARCFQKLAERKGKAGAVGEELLNWTERLFHHWHRIRDGTIKESTFRQNMYFVRLHVERLLAQGQVCGHAKTERTCKNILELREALWTFTRIPGLEPTNNEAERALRKAVLWRKSSFGSWSEAGSVFAARMLTVSETCRKQDRNVLDYLVTAVTAHQRRSAFPSLVPAA